MAFKTACLAVLVLALLALTQAHDIQEPASLMKKAASAQDDPADIDDPAVSKAVSDFDDASDAEPSDDDQDEDDLEDEAGALDLQEEDSDDDDIVAPNESDAEEDSPYAEDDAQTQDDVESQINVAFGASKKPKCPRLMYRNNAGKCVRFAPCASGKYRVGNKCKRLPQPATCNAEYEVLLKRKRAEDPLRNKELQVIRTIRRLVKRLLNVKDASAEAEAQVQVNDLLPLLQTASSEERDHAVIKGPKGILALLRNLIKQLKDDAIAAQKEVDDLHKHCATECTKAIAAQTQKVESWKVKKANKEQQIKDVQAKVELWKGKVVAKKLELQELQNTYRHMKKERDEENALIDWLMKRCGDVRAVKYNETENVQMDAADFLPVVTAVDEANPKFAHVIEEMQRPHPELNVIEGFLKAIKDKNIADDLKDRQKIAATKATLAAWEQKVVQLQTLLALRKQQLATIIGHLEREQKYLDLLKKQCAAFGNF